MKTIILATALVAAALTPMAAEAQNQRHDRDNREWNDRNRHDDRHDWNQRNRHDNWQSWRNSHREVYRRGNWNAPFRYRNFSVGVIMPRTYWGSNFYVNNWNDYRLPAPGYRLRYVRHYDDLLLVDTRTGRVVRVYRNFYW